MIHAERRHNKDRAFWPGKYNENGTLKEEPRVNLPFQVTKKVMVGSKSLTRAPSPPSS